LSFTSPDPPCSPQTRAMNHRRNVVWDKALRVLKSETIPYDPMHALILCSNHGYTPGLILLWKKTGMYEDITILDGSGERGNTLKIIAGGSTSQQIRLSATSFIPTRSRFFTPSPELLSQQTTGVQMVLEHIDKERIMPPLGVIQVLIRNGMASVGFVKQWLTTRIKKSMADIQTVRSRLHLAFSSHIQVELTCCCTPGAATHQLVPSGDQIEAETGRRAVGSWTPDVTRCSTCSGRLVLPSIHFMCDHGYHQRCVLRTIPYPCLC
jgi:hypothetical protein